jgi:DNA-binding HxlR family transcriptional regulator
METGQRPGTVVQNDVYSAHCRCRALLDLIANKWSTLVIGAMEEEPQRFGALLHRLEGVTPKMLTQTLRRLEARGLITRTIYPEVPLHVEYQLTALGWTVVEPLAALRKWAEANAHLVTME